MMLRPALCALLLALAGCSSVVHQRYEPQVPAPKSRYRAEPGRSAAEVERMRASPAPAIPELTLGTNQAGDHARLIAQGFVLVGTGHYAGPEGAARGDAVQQGQRVGADRIMLYAPTTNAATDADWTATYYVRLQLLFGATFRDMRPDERTRLHVEGGVSIGAVIGGTPASRANLRTGDLVLSVDNKSIADRGAFQSLLKAHAGHSVTLSIVRNGVTLQRVVRLGAMPDNSDH